MRNQHPTTTATNLLGGQDSMDETESLCDDYPTPSSNFLKQDLDLDKILTSPALSTTSSSSSAQSSVSSSNRSNMAPFQQHAMMTNDPLPANNANNQFRWN